MAAGSGHWRGDYRIWTAPTLAPKSLTDPSRQRRDNRRARTEACPRLRVSPDGIDIYVPYATAFSALRARMNRGTTTGSSSFKPLQIARATTVFGDPE